MNDRHEGGGGSAGSGRAGDGRTGRRRPPRRDGSREPKPVRVSPARIVAYEVLEAVRTDEAYANLLMPNRIERSRLSPEDAALATELGYGTLRMQGFYDAVIALAAGRPTDRIDPPVLDILRLGAHQLLATRVPTHAAVNESVVLAKRIAPGATGFVNAVLRTISRTSPDEWREHVVRETPGGADAKLAAVSSHPKWIVRALRAALAHEQRDDELEALLAADNAAPRVNLVSLPGTDIPGPDDLGTPNEYSPLGFTAGHPLALVEQSQGRVRVQDEGSQLAALALTRARPIVPGERWLDLCAGPGGKTAILAAEALAGGAVVAANEVVPARAELVRTAIAGVPLPVAVHELDGREIDAAALGAEGGFDRILLDAPCTGLGALRRRPEARWRKQPADVAELTRLQGELIDAALRSLKPGGVLAYVTCSPHTAETFGALNAALERHAGTVAQLDTHAVVGAVSRHPLDLGGAPETVQLWPHRHGTDAMFIALLERTA
ncbi:rRNA small subunit methyltransferase B [Agromyces sp. SYSU K20354]|uniref:RsmB/NOP family class I SAM-dependent RNA methyltransferase n=1 Tax=Agromyces cavernae TaxID=2898659 RepID=UPI001E3A1717|nr:transcription antitermination factor NusB [Agromyces cavernae]MCD2442283.1 rRNA small subunit methyltransferase B [Agromyces cavernae]